MFYAGLYQGTLASDVGIGCGYVLLVCCCRRCGFERFGEHYKRCFEEYGLVGRLVGICCMTLGLPILSWQLCFDSGHTMGNGGTVCCICVGISWMVKCVINSEERSESHMFKLQFADESLRIAHFLM